MRKKQNKAVHPFFCVVKGCRKTAWGTPEYLTASDIAIIEELSGVKTLSEFVDIVYRKRLCEDLPGESFFYRIMGWPEGRTYVLSSYREGSNAYLESLLSYIAKAVEAVAELEVKA